MNNIFFKYTYNHESKINKRLYSNFTSANKNKILGKTRHYPFSNKEWKDSVYNYNKTNLKESFSKYKVAHRLIKHHFNIDNLKSIARSRRMRSLIVRSSSKRIIVAKPDIKQTNDKIVITVYSYDRQRQALIRNLYFYNRKSYVYNLWLTAQNQRIFNGAKNTKLHSNKHTKSLKSRFPYKNIKLKNEMDFFKFRSLDFYRKLLNINNNSMFLFLSSLLSYFNVKIFHPFGQSNMINKKINNKWIKNIINKKPKILIVINNRSNKLNIIKKSNINLDNLKLISIKQNINTKKTSTNWEKLNNYLWYFITDKLIFSKNVTKQQIISLYVKFKNNYYDRIMTNYFKTKSKMLGHFIKLELNKLKFTSLLLNLKNFMGKLYDKNAELNVVNLKYIYLNSDIYTQLIANKMRKKSNITKILRKSLKLIKLPYHFLLKNKKYNFNDYREIDKYKSSKLTNSYYSLTNNSTRTDKLGFVFDKLFPNPMIHIKNNNIFDNEISKTRLIKKSKVINILNTIKYKWVKGVKLEIAGRLTRRNTASRSVFKYRYKGNLNNKQYYLESGLLNSLSTVMLRNFVKANSQYTLVNSKRRIGAFGIKSWISSY